MEQVTSDKTSSPFKDAGSRKYTSLQAWGLGPWESVPLGTMLGTRKGSDSRTMSRIHSICFLFLTTGLSSGSSQKPERLAELKKQKAKRLELGS